MSNLLEKSILASFCYYDIFDYPLYQKEIWQFLLLKPRLKLKFRDCLRNLKKKKKISQEGNFYFLPKREKIVYLRKKREQYSREKLKLAKRIVRILSFIPWIKMMGITGALAMNNSKKDDDIDLLIITSENRLWLTRLVAAVILEIWGKRRRPRDKNIKDKVCLNMFLDEANLCLVKEKRNLFTAHEIVQMKPILNRGQTYEKFLAANLWLRKYLPNSLEIKKLMETHKNLGKKKQTKNFLISNNFNKFLYFLEKIVYQLQRRYMKSKMTSESVSLHFAFFHPKDRTKEILGKYKKRLSQIMLK